MTITLVLMMAYLLTGCKGLPVHDSSESLPSLSEAQKLLEAGELHSAKKLTQAFLEDHPNHAEGVQLMGRILDQEISRHKEAFQSNAPEELSQDHREEQIKTWLEQGRSLLEMGAYDEAALTIESIFQYDPQHAEASALMDEIQNQAFAEGKREMEGYSEIVHSEVETRLSLYKRQARTWIQEGKWGAARLAIEKILMLVPEDEEALELLKEIKARQD